METRPFTIEYLYNGVPASVEVRPCCNNNAGDYAIWQNEKLLFTITSKNLTDNGWVVGMKNADKEVNQQLVKLIGERIDRRNGN